MGAPGRSSRRSRRTGSEKPTVSRHTLWEETTCRRPWPLGLPRDTSFPVWTGKWPMAVCGPQSFLQTMPKTQCQGQGQSSWRAGHACEWPSGLCPSPSPACEVTRRAGHGVRNTGQEVCDQPLLAAVHLWRPPWEPSVLSPTPDAGAATHHTSSTRQSLLLPGVGPERGSTSSLYSKQSKNPSRAGKRGVQVGHQIRLSENFLGGLKGARDKAGGRGEEEL